MNTKKKAPPLCGYFWILMAGSLLGVVIEGVFCLIRKGKWETHSALVLGPFVLVYGIGMLAVYLLACILYNKNILLQFVIYFMAGALVEYFFSLFQEIFFDSVSWNYSGHFLNIGGRVSLKMTLGWGILGVLFVKFAYKPLRALLQKKVNGRMKIVTIIVALFMLFNIVLSALAVLRWHARIENRPANTTVEKLLDKNFDNSKMQKIYTNINFVK